MRVVVNNFAARSGGALSILTDLNNYIECSNANFEWIFIISEHYFDSIKIKYIVLKSYRKSWIKRILFDFITGRHIINKLKPDFLISLQNTYTYGVKAKQFVYLHQALPFYPEARFSFFSKNERKAFIVQRFIGHFIFRSLKHAYKVIVQTNSMKERIYRKLSLNSKKIVVIHPNIDISILKNINPNLGITLSQFIVITSNHKYKNNNIVLEAIDVLVQKGLTNFIVKFTLAGNSTSNIQYIGKVSRQQIFEELRTSVLVIPSIVESYPLSLQEGQIAGTIILASKTDFSLEILDSYPNGHFFSPNNSHELATLMEKCIKKEIKYTPFSYKENNNNWNLLIKEISES